MSMTNLFGEPYTEQAKKRKPQDKERRAWENAFQRWSNKASQDGTSPHYVPEVCDGHYCPMDCEDGHCPWADEAMEFLMEMEDDEDGV